MVYNVAAILWLQFMVHVMLLQMINIFYFYISTFWSMCTVSNTLLYYCYYYICYHLYAEYLQLHTWNKPCF